VEVITSTLKLVVVKAFEKGINIIKLKRIQNPPTYHTDWQMTLHQVPEVTDEIPICEAEHLHTFSATKIRSTEIKAMLLCVVHMFKVGHCNHVFPVSLPCAQSHLLPAHKVDVARVSLT